MIYPSLLQNSLLPLNSIQLGRFVSNAKNPQQDFFDPPNGPAEFTVKYKENFKVTHTRDKSSKLLSRLTALIAISHENRDGNAVNLTADRATTYHLLNSEAWFKTACVLPETRKWFESAVRRRCTMYLIVGYHTLTDTRVTESATTSGTTNGGAHASGSSLSGGATPVPMGNLVEASIGSTRDVGYHRTGSFDAPGEQIYAIQYRKVKSNFFRGRKIDGTSLERDNRWKIYWEELEVDRPVKFGMQYRREGYHRHDEESDDGYMVEVDLTDEIDFELNGREFDEDGVEFIL